MLGFLAYNQYMVTRASSSPPSNTGAVMAKIQREADVAGMNVYVYIAETGGEDMRQLMMKMIRSALQHKH